MKEKKADRLIAELLSGSAFGRITMEQADAYMRKEYCITIASRGSCWVVLSQNRPYADIKPKGMTSDIARVLGIPIIETRELGFKVMLNESGVNYYDPYQTVFQWDFPTLESAWVFLSEKAGE